jgi:hypothetical protein
MRLTSLTKKPNAAKHPHKTGGVKNLRNPTYIEVANVSKSIKIKHISTFRSQNSKITSRVN